ncbi:hypothetical protein HKX48_001744 [Thoreauomyces humboldtii]|nr:hypothetical protein HKX48_001744 [Thoreauomyces humboldtii]
MLSFPLSTSFSFGHLILGIIAASLYRSYRGARPKVIVGEKVIIFGASTGIGRSLALLYAARGADLILVSRRLALLEGLAVECRAIRPHGRQGVTHPFACDVTDAEDVKSAAQEARRVLGGDIDTVVINAGRISVLPFADLAEGLQEAVEGLFRVNVYGPMWIAREFRDMLRLRRGKFLVVSSVAARLGAPTRTLYSASKHALNGFFSALRIELAKEGVDVCIVMPGSVATDLRASAVDASPVKAGSEQPERKADPRVMTPEQCAKGILDAGDRRARETYLPQTYRWAVLLHEVLPAWIDGKAAKKYGF